MTITATTPLRAGARLFTGSAYALLSYAAFATPGGRTQQAASTLAAMRTVVPLPEDDELVVRANGAAQAVAGTMLALGQWPRMSASVLAVSLVPTTLAGHAFWKIEDPAARKLQQTQFIKNMALLGGLLFAVADRPRR